MTLLLLPRRLCIQRRQFVSLFIS